MRLLVEAGNVAATFQGRLFHNLNLQRLQLDEMWLSLQPSKRTSRLRWPQRTLAHGDVWLWVAIDADSELVLCWTLGGIASLVRKGRDVLEDWAAGFWKGRRKRNAGNGLHLANHGLSA
jgi:hypothetical protein